MALRELRSPAPAAQGLRLLDFGARGFLTTELNTQYTGYLHSGWLLPRDQSPRDDSNHDEQPQVGDRHEFGS
jgi:hypothetical protein